MRKWQTTYSTSISINQGLQASHLACVHRLGNIIHGLHTSANVILQWPSPARIICGVCTLARRRSLHARIKFSICVYGKQRLTMSRNMFQGMDESNVVRAHHLDVIGNGLEASDVEWVHVASDVFRWHQH